MNSGRCQPTRKCCSSSSTVAPATERRSYRSFAPLLPEGCSSGALSPEPKYSPSKPGPYSIRAPRYTGTPKFQYRPQRSSFESVFVWFVFITARNQEWAAPKQTKEGRWGSRSDSIFLYISGCTCPDAGYGDLAGGSAKVSDSAPVVSSGQVGFRRNRHTGKASEGNRISSEGVRWRLWGKRSRSSGRADRGWTNRPSSVLSLHSTAIRVTDILANPPLCGYHPGHHPPEFVPGLWRYRS